MIRKTTNEFRNSKNVTRAVYIAVRIIAGYTIFILLLRFVSVISLKKCLRSARSKAFPLRQSLYQTNNNFTVKYRFNISVYTLLHGVRMYYVSTRKPRLLFSNAIKSEYKRNPANGRPNFTFRQTQTQIIRTC